MNIINLFTNSYFRWHMWYNLKCYFKSQQSWLIKEIPRTWCDKVELIPLILFTILVHFVEEEERYTIENLDQDFKDNYIQEEEYIRRKKILQDIASVYNYIKYDRVEITKKLDISYPKRISDDIYKDRVVNSDGSISHTIKSVEELYGMSSKEAYKNVFKYEKMLEKKDTEAIINIIKLRHHLWT